MNTLSHSSQFTRKENDFILNNIVETLEKQSQNQPEKTAFIFLEDGETETAKLTYQQLKRKSQAIASILQSQNLTDSRLLLLYPPGLEFISAFFGCLAAKAIPLPAYPPRLNRSLSHLEAIVSNAQPQRILTTTSLLPMIQSCLRNSQLAQLVCLTTDDIAESYAEVWQKPKLNLKDLAFLQYTSGSTGKPKGVMITHGNLLHNSEQIRRAFELTSNSVSVSWLPSFHDMGLIDGIIQPIYTGFLGVLMSPSSFLQKPRRWLQAISRYQATHCGGPNFAYDLCVRKHNSEEEQNLDLSKWSSAYNGAEPIRRNTLEKFIATYQQYGFRPHFCYPCYGMAEATLMITGGNVGDKPVYCMVEAEALEQNQIVTTAKKTENVRQLVGCGFPRLNTQVVIVNPESLTECNEEQVGEIWIAGDSVAQGYWQNSEQTKQTFHAYLKNTGKGPFLRTGDLGFFKDGELFITGRVKDLIIIRGHNHYPQDIELTVENSHVALRTNGGAAFSIVVKEQEQLVIVQEIERTYLRKLKLDEIVRAICQSVGEEHNLKVYTIVLLKPASLPKTTSGKVQRRACRTDFLKGKLNVVADWSVNPQNKAAFRVLEAEVEAIMQNLQTRFPKHISLEKKHFPNNTQKTK
jgi:acyl-CoA synthetase (AMP-forming)/AMP-acid ligase II